MSEQIVRPRRDVGIADHIWETFAQMAADMGVDRESLVNQALFAFARTNGYSVAARPASRASEPPVAHAPAPLEEVLEAHDAVSHDVVSEPPPAPRLSLAPILPSEPPPPVRPPVAAQPVEAFDAPEVMEDDAADLLLEKAEELQRAALAESHPSTPPATPLASLQATPLPAPAVGALPALVLVTGGRELEPVQAEHFLIGRAKHCDLIINSGKVSREHAVIVRESDGWYIEDRQSSNGTWFEKARVTRRRIEDGDEYLICEEKIACRLR
jgi:hypothetical protein